MCIWVDVDEHQITLMDGHLIWTKVTLVELNQRILEK